METLPVFVSVGATANRRQEDFVQAIETRLRSEGLLPHTVGRNTFTSDSPLTAVIDLLDKTAGAVVIAFERSFFPSGMEKRGGSGEAALQDIKLPTPWNHIEAGMAYLRGKPLLVIAEAGLKREGLIENGYDWYVQWVELTRSALSTAQFNGVLADWKAKVVRCVEKPAPVPTLKPTADLTIGELVSGLRPAQLWGLLAAMVAVVGGAFALGARLPLSPETAKMVVDQGTDRPSSIDAGALERLTDPVSCEKACKADVNCKSFAFIPTGKPYEGCHLRKTRPPPHPLDYATSGAKCD